MDIKLNKDTHDLELGRDFTLTPDEPDSTRQKVIIKLLTFRSEFFLDASLGTPFYQSILGKGRSKETIDSIIQASILEVPEVLEISKFRSSVNRENRVYSLNFTIRTQDSLEAIPIELTI